MSDFLQIEDEIIDGDPQYLVTDNVNGTKSITLANEIIHEGTALNKVELTKRLNKICGYNETTSEITSEENIIQQNITNIYQNNVGRVNIVVNNVEYSKSGTLMLLENTNLINVTLLGKRVNANYGIVESISNSLLHCSINGNYNAAYGKLIFDSVLKAKKISGHMTSSTAGGDAVCTITYLDNDGVEQSKGVSIVSQSSRDGVDWSLELDDFYIIKNIYISPQGDPIDFYIYSILAEISQIQYVDNETTIDSLSNEYDNNQILNIKTNSIDTTQTISYCKVNNINCDSILQSNRFYELLYDETNDRFIAEEVRV